jgi:hypothetical protein
MPDTEGLFDPIEDDLPPRDGDASRDDIFPPRTDRQRAKEYLRRRPPRPKAPPQTEGLFPEPEHQDRRLVPLGQNLGENPDQPTLFDVQPCDKRYVAAGWPEP